MHTTWLSAVSALKTQNDLIKEKYQPIATAFSRTLTTPRATAFNAESFRLSCYWDTGIYVTSNCFIVVFQGSVARFQTTQTWREARLVLVLKICWKTFSETWLTSQIRLAYDALYEYATESFLTVFFKTKAPKHESYIKREPSSAFLHNFTQNKFWFVCLTRIFILKWTSDNLF